jgi:rod shape-determining protein MreD
MHWLSYFILAYVALGVQVALNGGGFIDVKGAAPNFVLLVVIFLAVNGGREPVLLGAFLLGLMQDLLTLHPLGTWAVTYSLVAMFVLSTQEIVYREHPLTHFSLALSGGILCAIVLTLHGWIYPLFHGRTGADTAVGPVGLFASSIYTAILAPIVLGVLQRMKRAFSFRKRL